MTASNIELQREVAALLVESLNLDIAPNQSTRKRHCMATGSAGFHRYPRGGPRRLSALRISTALQRPRQRRIFTSLASLTEHIAAHRVG